MCFSFEVSLATGLFSWSIGLFLLSKANQLKKCLYRVDMGW